MDFKCKSYRRYWWQKLLRFSWVNANIQRRRWYQTNLVSGPTEPMQDTLHQLVKGYMPKIYFFPIPTLDPKSQWWCASKWGVVTCGSHGGSCFNCRFRWPVEWQKTALWDQYHRTDTHTCLLAHVSYHIGPLIWLGHHHSFRQDKTVRPSKRSEGTMFGVCLFTREDMASISSIRPI